MYRTADKLLNIMIAPNIGSLIFQPVSWSVIDIPDDSDEAKNLFGNLYNMPNQRHVSLVLNRQRRKDKINTNANLAYALDSGWQLMDSITISYDKPSSCSNNRLLPISEPGYIIYKGSAPDSKTTGWFNDDFSNATTHWDVSACDGELPASTHFQKFNWQTILLMRCLAAPLEQRSFLYLCDIDDTELESLYRFCSKLHISVFIRAESSAVATEMLKKCNTVAMKIQEEKQWNAKP